MKKVSVIVRAYNASKYIKEALKSILMNTYRGPIEIIVCYDEGSKDDTLERVEAFIRYIREAEEPLNREIKIVRHEHMTPFKALLNCGLSNATGDYVMILDYDNLYPPKHIEVLVNTANKSGKNFLFVRTYFFIDETLKIIGGPEIPKQPCNIINIIHRNYVDGSAMFIRRDCLRIILKKLRELQHRFYEWIFEDWLIALLALKNCDCLFVKESYIFYRVHSANITARGIDTRTAIFNNVREIATLIAFYELEQKRLSKEEKKAIAISLSERVRAIAKHLNRTIPNIPALKALTLILKLYRHLSYRVPYL